MQKKKRKQYTVEFKAKVVKEMLREERTVGQLAAEYPRVAQRDNDGTVSVGFLHRGTLKLLPTKRERHSSPVSQRNRYGPIRPANEIYNVKHQEWRFCLTVEAK